MQNDVGNVRNLRSQPEGGGQSVRPAALGEGHAQHVAAAVEAVDVLWRNKSTQRQVSGRLQLQAAGSVLEQG